MNCSRCEFAAKITDAEYIGMRYEDTPCARCKLTENSTHTMEYDDEIHTPEVWPSESFDGSGADMMPVSVLAEAVKGFLELPQRTFRILQRRMKGDAYALIAQELEVTPQAVEVQLKRALEAHPHLRSLLPAKARKQEARKRKKRSMARRGKPGVGAKMEGGC